MANVTTGRVWVLDTPAIISEVPIKVQQMILYPNAAADSAVFNYWDYGVKIALGCDDTYDSAETGTISSTDTLTISGGTLLPSAIADGTVFRILDGSGSTANFNKPFLVKTAGNNTAVVLHNDPLTDESTKEYRWETYQNYLAAKLVSAGTEKCTEVLDLGGFIFPNLILETISASASVVLYIA